MQQEHYLNEGGLQGLHDIAEDNGTEKLVNLIESKFDLYGSDLERVYKAISDSLKREYSEALESAIFGFLLGGESEEEHLKDELPQNMFNTLQDLKLQYQEPLMTGYMQFFEPNEWRHLTSSSRYNDRGARLETKILRWDGEEFTISADPHNVINFAEHLIKNLNISFGPEALKNAEQVSRPYIERLKKEISTLESRIKSPKEEE